MENEPIVQVIVSRVTEVQAKIPIHLGSSLIIVLALPVLFKLNFVELPLVVEGRP